MSYNGYKNRATWNVCLWINNDYELYSAACDFMRTYKGKRPYIAFIKAMGLMNERTPDRIKWYSQQLDYKELNACMFELTN